MKPYQQEISALLSALETQKTGLSSDFAQQRLESEGLNKLQTEVQFNRWKLFLSQFQSFIIYIMLAATVMSVLVGEYADAVVILIILIANALVGYYQELGAQKSLEALKKMSIVQARVYRDGKIKVISAEELVRGDVIVLEAGDKVPADARLLEASQLRADESPLTGESVPSEKHTRRLESELSVGDQENMVFASTNITNGSGKAIVTATAMDTEIGKITDLVKTAEEQLTPLQMRLEKFGEKLGLAVIAICVLVFVVMGGKAYLRDALDLPKVLEVLLVAVALAVAAVPSGLPAVVTIALSVGVKKLLRRNALVRKLASVETLGSCDVICSDKTGTLTQNEMTVTQAYTAEGKLVELTGVGYSPEGTVSEEIDPLLFEIGFFCNKASLFEKNGEWKVAGDPTEGALLVSAAKAGVDDARYEVLQENSFDSDRKRMSVWVKNKESGKKYTFVKGAPDQVLAVCTSLSEADETRINRQIKAFSDQALRVLAFAYAEAETEADFREENLRFVGIQAMMDPPRHEVLESITKTKKAGIRVIMITGDHRDTAEAIGHQIGIEGGVLSGAELNELSDKELEAQLDAGVNIFARVIPEHKQRIVAALQRLKHTVAMTGDGVNDAPALKSANIGVAVGSGTEVAKEASDFVLLNDSFANIVSAIEEGRGIYENIQKSLIHLLSGNLSEVLVITVAVLLGWPLPLTAIMLLWINLVTDGAPALALAVDPYGDDLMERAPKHKGASILPRDLLTLTGVLGVWATLIALGLFFYFENSGSRSHIHAQTIAFCFVVISESVLLLNARTYFGVKFLTNTWLWGAILGGFALQAMLLYVPFFNRIFELVPLSLAEIGILLAAGAVLYLLGFLTQVIVKKTVGSRVM